ncbi:MAG: hypothetical protein NVS2B4_20770 [Ramlibacter sp.]
MSGYEGATQRLQLPCPNCGETEFTGGTLFGNLHVKRDTSKVDEWLAGSLVGLVVVKLRARICDTCGHLDLFLEDQ